MHISPAIGKRQVAAVTTEDVERLASRMLASGSSPKTVRNVMTFLHSVFGLAVRKGWAPSNPVEDAARPKRRRGRRRPRLQFLTPAELDALFDVIPDHTVDRDALGPVVRLVVLVAGTTGLRQSELLGLRWRDVDMRAQRVRVRNAWVRYEHSGEGKSDLSTQRSVPMSDRLVGELQALATADGLRRRRGPGLRAPRAGRPAGPHEGHAQVPTAARGRRAQIRFQDLRHTFATTLAAAGVPLRTIQECKVLAIPNPPEDRPDWLFFLPYLFATPDGRLLITYRVS